MQHALLTYLRKPVDNLLRAKVPESGENERSDEQSESVLLKENFETSV